MDQDHPSREAALERAKASLNHYLAGQRDLRQAHTAAWAKIEEKQRQLLLGHVPPNELNALAGERRRVLEASAARSMQRRGQGFAPLGAPRADTAGGAVFVGHPTILGGRRAIPMPPRSSIRATAHILWPYRDLATAISP